MTSLADHDPASKAGLADKAAAERELHENVERIADLQIDLWAENRRALLVILQGVDTSGKDGAIRHVFSGVNPQGVKVQAFGKPTPEELDHDFLWRIHRAIPARGEIGVFNRSHYEDVLIARVEKLAPKEVIEQRYDTINHFERLLADPPGGYITILKFFLHISRKEQRERLLARITDRRKGWKANPADLAVQEKWDEYQRAYELVLDRCDTKHAPWHIIPADHKWVRNALISRAVRKTLEEMRPQPPKPPPGLDAMIKALR